MSVRKLLQSRPNCQVCCSFTDTTTALIAELVASGAGHSGWCRRTGCGGGDGRFRQSRRGQLRGRDASVTTPFVDANFCGRVAIVPPFRTFVNVCSKRDIKSLVSNIYQDGSSISQFNFRRPDRRLWLKTCGLVVLRMLSVSMGYPGRCECAGSSGTPRRSGRCYCSTVTGWMSGMVRPEWSTWFPCWS